MRGSSLTIADGQTIDNITIPMSRGGAITGRVVDAYGDPVENVDGAGHPRAAERRGRRHAGRGGMRSFQSSNDIGEYRISRLEPGQYLPAGHAAAARHGSEDGGSAPGRTFYPGVASIDQAQPITIERGQSIGRTRLPDAGNDADQSERLRADRQGHPGARRPRLGAHRRRQQGPARGIWRMPDDGGSGIDQNGAFELMLQPGEYIIEAMAAQGDEARRDGQFRDGSRPGDVWWSRGESMSGVTIAAGARRHGQRPLRVQRTQRAARRASRASASGFTGPNGCRSATNAAPSTRPTVNPDGTFTAENMWGTCQIRGGGTAKGWTFEAVMHNGNDITNRAIEFGAGRSISGIEIVYTDRVGELTVDGGRRARHADSGLRRRSCSRPRRRSGAISVSCARR